MARGARATDEVACHGHATSYQWLDLHIGSFHSVLYKLSQPQFDPDNFLRQSDTFFSEDIYCSPKYRQYQHERDGLKIRFEDGSNKV